MPKVRETGTGSRLAVAACRCPSLTKQTRNVGIRMEFIAKYVHTYKELALVDGARQREVRWLIYIINTHTHVHKSMYK